MNRANEQDHTHGDILVIEDQPTNLNLLDDILTNSGYQVRPATDGELALRSVQAKLPELILLDYKMPGMDGIEVCQHLKADPKTRDIPVIFISGMEEADSKIKALEAGAIDYLTKPVVAKELLVRIANHLKLFRLQKELVTQSEQLRQENNIRIKAEQDLQQALEREHLLADIVRNAPVAIAYGYPDGRLRNCNPAFSKLTGYTIEELQEVNWSQTLTPEKWLKNEFEILSTLSATQKIVRYEKEYIHKNGAVVPIELVVSAIFDFENKPLNYIGFILDISQRKKMEQHLFHNEKLSTIAGLAAGVAHEINTPLTAILQSHQLIDMGLSPKETTSRERAAECNVDLVAVQDYLHKNELDYFMTGIRDSALKASHIINNLLEFSRPHGGNFSTGNMTEIMDSSVLLSLSDYDLKKQYDINSVHFSKEYAPHLPALICVPQEIEQVILNLIKNSVQALAIGNTAGNSCVTLGLRATETSAFFIVTDNGPGMSSKDKKHIFDPFFTTMEVGCGTGLGLSVSHTIIVEKHHGGFRVESEPGQGTTFTIKLPLNQEV